jgi:uncharacterized protein YdeI (YjbR/CyaY-like superfamily)
MPRNERASIGSALDEPAGGSGDEAPVHAFRSALDFERWLAGHVDARSGVWLKLAKKKSGVPSLSSDEAVDVGLCFGWISGQRRPLDERFYLQKYVPRRPRSLWSRVNVEKVEALLVTGRIRPSGLAEVDAAKSDGRWAAAYESQRNATLPSDLRAALSASRVAGRAFDALGKTQRYTLVLKLVTARTERGRLSRLSSMITSLESQARDC